jgi:hypothetical protein
VTDVTATALPPDARFLELRPEALLFETRTCLLPGTLLAFTLVLEGHPLALQAPVEALMVAALDRTGYVFHCRIPLAPLASSDRHLIGLFIGKGRGSPGLVATPEPPK